MLYTDDLQTELLGTEQQRTEVKIKAWDEYIKGNDLADNINYYRPVITAFIINHMKNQNNKAKDQYRSYCLKELVLAIDYSIKSGFYACIDWLALSQEFKDNKPQPLQVKLSDLAKNNAEQVMLKTCLYSWQNDDRIKQQLNNSDNYTILEDIKVHCNNAQEYVLNMLFVLWKHGFVECIDTLRHYFHVKTDKLLYSSVTHLPINQVAKLTPAFYGENIHDSATSETWVLRWNFEYNELDYSELPPIYTDYSKTMFVLDIIKTNVAKIKQGIANSIAFDKDVANYLQSNHFLQLDDPNVQENTIVPVLFTTTNDFTSANMPRELATSEINQLMNIALVDTISRKLNIPRYAVVLFKA